MTKGRSRDKARIFLLLSILLIACAFAAGRAFPEVIRTAATGQVTCYNSAGDPIACKGTGQDGEFQAGRVWPNPRFTINPDGCSISDNLTGLMWAANGMMTSCVDSWQVVLASVSTLYWCNYGDWRPANVNELASLSNASQPDLLTWLAASGFNHLQRTAPYFSSSSYLDGQQGTGAAWSMAMQDGTTLGQSKQNNQCIRLVRGGFRTQASARVGQTGETNCYNSANGIIPCPFSGQDAEYEAGASWVDLSPARFVDVGDGTVIDQFTQLMWTKDAATPGPGTGPSPLCITDTAKTWQQALDYVKQCLNSDDAPFLGYRDWRLPNKNELASLIDRSQNTPALPSGHPFANVMTTDGTFPQLGGHWSSTTSLRTRSAAWVIDMTLGQAIGYGKTGTLHVWPVRGNFLLLTVTTTDPSGGPATGTVSRSAPGKACSTYATDAACSAAPPEWPAGSSRYNKGMTVTLTPHPDVNSVFSGWSGGGCPQHSATCTVAMAQDFTVTASFTSAPTLSVSPSSNAYGVVKSGKKASAAYTVTNRVANGRQPLGIGLITLSGTDAGQFAMGATDHCSNTTLNPGKSCVFYVVFSPTSQGTKHAQIDISSTTVPVQSKTVPIRGTGR